MRGEGDLETGWGPQGRPGAQGGVSEEAAPHPQQRDAAEPSGGQKAPLRGLPEEPGGRGGAGSARGSSRPEGEGPASCQEGQHCARATGPAAAGTPVDWGSGA